MKNFKIRSILKYLSVISVCLMIISITIVSLLAGTFFYERNQHEIAKEYYLLGNQLLSASDYLTDQIKHYVQFGDKKYYNNYQMEIHESQNREKAVEQLKQMGTDSSYMKILQDALNKSNQLAEIEEKAFKEVEKKSFDSARKLVFGEQYEELKHQVIDEILRFTALVNEKSDAETQLATKNTQAMMFLLYVSIIMFSLFVLVTLVIVSGRIKVLTEVQRAMDELSKKDGDLTNRIESGGKDEIALIAASFNLFAEKVQQIVKNTALISEELLEENIVFTENVSKLATSSDLVSKTIEELAFGASEQAKHTENAAEKVGNIGCLLDENEENIKDLNRALAQMKEKKEAGVSIIRDLHTKSQENREVAQKIARLLQDNSQSTLKIEKASQMIENIASQTNLLALNATIEAARAGEVGKGFAVVAEEIQKLAEQSNRFTEEIKGLIMSLSKQSADSIEQIEKVKAVAEMQGDSVNNTTAKFEEIAEEIMNTQKMLDDLNQSEKRLSESKEELLNLIENLAAIAEENAAGIEEASATLQEQNASTMLMEEKNQDMSRSVERLHQNINLFKYA